MKYTHSQILEIFAKAMEWAAEPELVYQRFVDASVECFEADAAHLHLLDINNQSFQHLASHDDLVDASYYSQTLSKNVGRMALIVDKHDLIVVEDYAHPHTDDVIPDAALQAGFRSGVSIPLVSSSGVLGILSLVFKTLLPWDEESRSFLLEVGSIIGIFIQRLQMQKKDLELHLLRERKQLSSEIHDNISQMVSALAIRADIAQECLETGDEIVIRKASKTTGILKLNTESFLSVLHKKMSE